MSGTLYLSDLDGTLLGSGGILSPYTRTVVNRFIDQGGLFSIATARTPNTAKKILNKLNLNVPVLLNNGAVTYDVRTDTYIEVVTIPLETVEMLYKKFVQMNITGFMYVLENKEIKVYYHKLRDPEDLYYYDSRFRIYGDNVYYSMDLVQAAAIHKPMFFVVYGRPERLNEIYKELVQIPGLTCSLCEDVYSGGEYYFIDIFSNQVSKAIGMKKLQKLVGAEKVAAFGDNFNDLDMLEQADEAYVPKNAVGAARNMATKVLDSNEENGVAGFLETLF